MKTKILKIGILVFLAINLTSCKGLFKYSDARENPVKGEERAKKNVEEGRGVALKNITGGNRGGTAYEFNTANPLWRASLEILDFMPLTSVNYSGGIIVTDWYSDSDQNEALKITVRFLNNEVSTNSLKIIVHQKKCTSVNSCTIKELDSSIKRELNENILKRASLIERETKKTKK
ncbi:DUF3576 domain-containing protein [Pelagibacteraceae bacterium]|nr:DUF3576 domain-containing protein [Pelagibacteraceae bacterium]